MNQVSGFVRWIKALPAWAKTLAALTSAILALIALSVLFQGHFIILALVFFPLLVIAVLLLATSIIIARRSSLTGSEARGFVLSRAIRIGAGLIVIAALAIVGAYLSSGPAAPLAITPTPASTFHPSTTVTPSPLDFRRKPPEPASAALQSLELIVLLVVMLVIPFTRPGAWNSHTLRDVSIGFLGWFLVNTLLWLWVDSSVAQSSGVGFFQPERGIPLLVNLAALLVFFFTRRWITLGMFAAILVNALGNLLVTPVTAFYGNQVMIRALAMVPFFLPPFFPNL